MLAKKGLQSLIAIIIFIVLSGIIGNIIFLFIHPLYFLTTIVISFVIYKIIKLIIKKRGNGKRK